VTRAGWLLLAVLGLGGCSVDVAKLTIAAPQPLSPAVLRDATSRGWRDGESCHLWVLGVPFGLPQIDDAMQDALQPVHAVYLRDATVYSVHPTYLLFGWHCYRVRGEAFG